MIKFFDCSTCFSFYASQYFMLVHVLKEKIVYITVHQSGQWPIICVYNYAVSFMCTVQHSVIDSAVLEFNQCANVMFKAVSEVCRKNKKGGVIIQDDNIT